MYHCDQCHERLLDFVYGALEEPELGEMRAHLDACPTCQAALEKAQTEKRVLAQAARPIRVVPEFAIPSEVEQAKPETPATLPLGAETAPIKRSLWRRPIVGWAAAAAILIAIVAPMSWYRHQVDSYQKEVAASRSELKKVDELLAAAPASHIRRHQEVINKLHADAAPYLHVVGPTTLQPGATGHLHITTRHPEGNLVAANVRVKLTDAASGDVVKVAHLQTDNNGHARADLDTAGAKPNSELNVVVEADTGLGQAKIQESLRVKATSHVVRIDTNKNIYQVKDVLFFRVLVLDRHTLQPPAQPIALHVELMHKNQAVRSLDGATGPGGVLAAEFAIEEKFAEGEYTLLARAADIAKVEVQAVAMPVEIVRDLPGIRIDPNSYFAGGTVTGDLVLRGKALPSAQLQGNLNGKPVAVTVQPQPKPVAQGVGGFGGGGGANPRMMAKGKTFGKKGDEKDKDKKDDAGHNSVEADALMYYRFIMPLPKDLPKDANALQLSVQVPGEAAKKLQAVVPLTPTEFVVDFHPEGGDLIAGVKNRVYFRVRAKTGEPVTGAGRLILWMKNKDDLQILVDEPYELGMGQFEFTPDAKETYTVRVTTPTSTAEIAQPFAKLGIRKNGVVLHVAKAVGAQEEPIRMTLRQQGPARKLLLVAQCRGQIVDERWVDVKNGSVDLTLEPTSDARGMIRVTAFEVVGAEVIPMAERLVYRASSHRLDLGFAPNMRDLDVGSKASAKITARDENGQPAAAWIFASVVDERFQTKPRSLSAHFLLMNEIRDGSDLDQAQIILHDSPASAAVLERFLGTHGWRRYVTRRETAIVPVAAGKQEPTLIFSRESVPMATAQKQYEQRLTLALTPIRAEAVSDELRLNSEHERLSTAVTVAAANLSAFETRIQLGGRLALGGLVGVMFAAAVVLMVIGTYRIVRANRAPTPAFGGAFACLIGCLSLLFVGTYVLGPIDAPGLVANQLAPGNPIKPNMDAIFAQQLPAIRPIRDQLPTGEFCQPVAGGDREERQALEGKAVHAAAVAQLAKAAKHEQLAGNLARARDGQALAAKMDRAAVERFENARGAADAKVVQNQKAPGGIQNVDPPPPAPIPAPPAPAPKDDKAPSSVPGAAVGAARMAEREFAHVHTPGLRADTLLWHPTLWLANGAGDVRFEVGSGQTTYRVLLLGHSPTGRFGFFETRIDATGAPR